MRENNKKCVKTDDKNKRNALKYLSIHGNIFMGYCTFYETSETDNYIVIYIWNDRRRGIGGEHGR